MKKFKLVLMCITGSAFLLSSAALAGGDPENGKKIAKKCLTCHTLKQGGKVKLGPNLFGILGKKAGSIEGYKYSKALSKSGIIWDEATFKDFIAKPRKVIKGTKMGFGGIKKATDRADLLAYFKTLQGQPDLVAPGNLADGKQAAGKLCAVCHSFEKGGKVVYGPNLFGIVGQKAGAIEGYNYSKALKESGLIWTDKNLVGFLSAPEQFVKGTKARFPGVKSAKQKADILTYMKSLK